MSALERRPSPPNDLLREGCLTDLVPQKIEPIPTVSLAHYRKPFREFVAKRTEEIDGDDGDTRRSYLDSDLGRQGKIAQLLGFANCGDETTNLYRQVVLGRFGKRQLIFNDYWDSMIEYEAYVESWKDDEEMVEFYRRMRDGVIWLTSNRDAIATAVDEWRLLLRIDSNHQMRLNINDADPLYVFIRHDDLANRVFTNLAGEVTTG
jgi:hypothetical protein